MPALLQLLDARCYQETIVHTGFDPEAPFTLPRVPHVEGPTPTSGTLVALEREAHRINDNLDQATAHWASRRNKAPKQGLRTKGRRSRH